MTVNRGFRYRLYPTPEQESTFRQYAGVCRVVYNAALEQRKNHYRQYRCQTGKALGVSAQCRELTALRAAVDWVATVHVTPQQQALRDLDRAFAGFFAGRAEFPTPRRKFENDSFRFQGREVETKRLNAGWSTVRLPKIGWVRFRDTRPLHGVVKNATIARDAIGWHIAFSVEFESLTSPAPSLAVGIDRGVANSIALSTGEIPAFPVEAINALDRKHRVAQRAVARRKRGSKRHAKAKRRVAALKARAARIRRHWNHEQSTRIARRFDVVCIEDLRVADMTRSARGSIEQPGHRVAQKSGLNRSILERGWSQMVTLLEYKLAERGSILIRIDPRNTSRRCPRCGHVDVRNRESQALFRCVECGHEAHADVNAAVNILRAGTRPPIEATASRRESRRVA